MHLDYNNHLTIRATMISISFYHFKYNDNIRYNLFVFGSEDLKIEVSNFCSIMYYYVDLNKIDPIQL